MLIVNPRPGIATPPAWVAARTAAASTAGESVADSATVTRSGRVATRVGRALAVPGSSKGAALARAATSRTARDEERKEQPSHLARHRSRPPPRRRIPADLPRDLAARPTSVWRS